MPKKNIPSHKNMFLYRSGLQLDVSDNFVNKFIEIYTDLWRQKKHHENDKPLTYDQAKFMILSVIESIIYILDFGYSVWVNRCMVFLPKTATFRPKGRYYAENVLKVCVKPIVSWINKMKDLANKDNEKYQQFLQDKRTRHNKIREYYKDLYDKQEDWWQ